MFRGEKKFDILQTLEQLNLSKKKKKKSPKACYCTLCFPFRSLWSFLLQFQFTRSTATALNYFEHCWGKKGTIFHSYVLGKNIYIFINTRVIWSPRISKSISLTEISYLNNINLNSRSVSRSLPVRTSPHIAEETLKNPWSGVQRELSSFPRISFRSASVRNGFESFHRWSWYIFAR